MSGAPLISPNKLGARTFGKIDTGAGQLCPTLRTSSASWRHSIHRQSPSNPHQHVSRCIARRRAALAVCRPPRWPPQCLDNLRSCRRRKGHSCPGLVKGIRRPVQGHQLSQLCRRERRIGRQQRRQRDHGTSRRIGRPSTRSVASCRGSGTSPSGRQLSWTGEGGPETWLTQLNGSSEALYAVKD